MHPARRAILAATLISVLTPACGDAGSASSPPAATAAAVAASDADSPAQTASDRHGERPLPAFEGRDLSGGRLAISSFIGKRLVLFFFNPEVDEAALVAGPVASVATLRRQNNFEVVGIAVGSSAQQARTFVREQGLDFPIFDDSDARITRRLGLRAPVVLLAVDPEGYLGFGMASFNTEMPDAARGVEAQLRQHLRLAALEDAGAAGTLAAYPQAPLFEAERLDGGEPFRLADLRGQAVVLVFFLHTCPHCHKALHFFQEQLAALPEAGRPALVGVSIQNRGSAVRAALQQQKLDSFPVLLDSDQTIRSAYGVFGGVPDIVLIDAEGRIAHRVRGWAEGRDPALARMVLAKLAGAPIPMLLNPKGYTGSDVCGVCHEAEHAAWEFTAHAGAFDTLITHGDSRDPECVSCHVVGFGEAGGYALDSRPAHLEAVGCENCHGRGGPHLSPEHAKKISYENACAGCHNPTHSLGFDYATFLPRVSHKAIAAATPEQRQAMRARRGVARGLLPSDQKLVGSKLCESCHASEYASWAASPHATALESLVEPGKAKDADCLACHTTGFGRPGGYPKRAGDALAAHRAGVGCESCHGAGEAHVADGSRKIGSILSLGDKCDSCVILQICGACHDDANDPDFRFEVAAHIDRQRHGTIEAGTGQPLEASASGAPSPTAAPARAESPAPAPGTDDS